ncbi:hypothetical protein BDW22DRAFT_1424501 [Trametopsis cervina]|nr:hypothetical protein BDW22DRAFT_1424501 [Trametopsis cervina]
MSDHTAQPPSAILTHPPAQKVGGRRMSLNSRPKPHIHHPVEQKVDSAVDDSPTDYPRPAPPTQQPNEEHHHQEEQPRHDRKHDPDHERKIQETLRKRAEQNRPSKDQGSASKTPIARVNQPNGRRLSM